MDTEIKGVIQSQYLAALAMLRETVVRCPEALWTAPAATSPFWHIAYHALFYVHLYLQPSERDFAPWAKHRPEARLLGQTPTTGELYSREDILDYLDVCRDEVRARVPNLDLTAPESGFDWLPFGKLEAQFYAIRHLQQHTGELAERLGAHGGIEVPWIGMER